ncbi:acyl carrier protein [Amycolatopsis albispora]|uniref:Carrier domain-containing protein n=1 Tax=Amycolatopsis albispora TaxID=1804986 RepID=A0A344L5I2_9PSEU|nr:phosphopantetheine-binding protein [Amycolatopsis albispora]AXB43306.1 hypothetical protein A4R43_12710 [Amycolatopsis albispora]
MEVTAVAREIREFVTRSLGTTVGDDEDYFELGLVNSLFAIELIAFVERGYAFTVEVDDLDRDNFRTVSRLAAFVVAKCAC